jgi:hypothetical protein
VSLRYPSDTLKPDESGREVILADEMVIEAPKYFNNRLGVLGQR